MNLGKFQAFVLAMALTFASAFTALAHHGWSWTQDGFFELRGKIAAITYANPHPTLDVDVEGEIWRVDLATPSATARAGFMEDTAKVGDEIQVIGNRSQDESQRLMKAVRIITGGKTYDVYPTRVPASN